MTNLPRTKIGSNMYVSITSYGALLFSYETPVAAEIGGAHFRTEEKWSVTTSRHINQWLGNTQAETKPQAFFDALADGRNPDLPEPTVVVGGIVLLVQQPADVFVDDEEAFADAVSNIEGFKEFDVSPIYFNGSYAQEAPSVQLINGVIPITFEVPDGVDLATYANQKAQEVELVWKKFAK